MVHVLGTNSWREIPQVLFYRIDDEGVFAHGCLHWLIGFNDNYWGIKYDQMHNIKRANIEHEYEHGPKITCFDVKKEAIRLIDPPPTAMDTFWICCDQLVDLNGVLGYVCVSYNGVLEVWVLLKHKVWVLHCRCNQYPPPPLNMVEMKVLGYWNKDGDILKTLKCWKRDPLRLFVYNLKIGLLHEIKSIGREYGHASVTRMYQIDVTASRSYSIKN